MDETPNLGLPYIMAAQSQKHVTHNEAIRALDAIVQLSVLDRDLTTAPGSPAEGARYIVAASPTGAWSGHAGDVAAFQDGAWAFYEPVEGFIAWIADEDIAVVWSGSAWTALTTGGGGGGGAGSFTTVGINATADATNRLAVAATATLLSHDGAGHQLKINKAAAGDTASLLYQDAFSGRAELGLAGDDDFHFKVSPDGSTWKEAILINRSSGVVTFPFTALSGGGRELLTANRTYYVRTDGSDSNNGLANTSGGAFLTLQHAYDVIAGTLDLGGYTVTIQGGNTPAFTSGLSIAQPWTGGGAVTLDVGGGSITLAGDNIAVTTVLPGIFKVQNVSFGTSSASHIFHGGVGNLTIGSGVTFGAAGFHMVAYATGAIINVGANTTISGGAAAHYYAANGGLINDVSHTITVSANITISTGFAFANTGIIQGFSNTYSLGAFSVTGPRYLSKLNGVVFVNGGGANYFPGNSAGSTATGGQYA